MESEGLTGATVVRWLGINGMVLLGWIWRGRARARACTAHVSIKACIELAVSAYFLCLSAAASSASAPGLMAALHSLNPNSLMLALHLPALGVVCGRADCGHCAAEVSTLQLSADACVVVRLPGARGRVVVD